VRATDAHDAEASWSEAEIQRRSNVAIVWEKASAFLRVLRGGVSAATSLDGALEFVDQCARMRGEAEELVEELVKVVEERLPKSKGERFIQFRVSHPKDQKPKPTDENGRFSAMTVYIYVRRLLEVEARTMRTVPRAVARMQAVLLANLGEGDVLQMHTLDREREFVEIMDKVEGWAASTYHQSFDVEPGAGDTTTTYRCLYDRMVDAYSEALACNVLLWCKEDKPIEGRPRQLIVGVWGVNGVWKENGDVSAVEEVHMRVYMGPVPGQEPEPEPAQEVVEPATPVAQETEKVPEEVIAYRGAKETACRACERLEKVLRAKLGAEDALEVAWSEQEPAPEIGAGMEAYQEVFLVDSPVAMKLKISCDSIAYDVMQRLSARFPQAAGMPARHMVVGTWAKDTVVPALDPHVAYGANMKQVYVRVFMARCKE
jgi:hypothetical protein